MAVSSENQQLRQDKTGTSNKAVNTYTYTDDNAYYNSLIGNTDQSEPSDVDPNDENTPDDWVKRDPSMIRLTGRHPFNAEPPLSDLMSHEFITPARIHYVRNHGYVPQATWEDWTVEVSGLVENPTTFTMAELEDFDSIVIPVTLVCSGNRREEVKLVKNTRGFRWGAAVVSTSVWEGVPLSAILEKCGIMSKEKGALYVCFEGTEDLPSGKYGTSVTREIAMDPSREILLAYKQNGKRLMPDHGFPVRIIIPGFIGGRMVKWLKRIIVSETESDSNYHYEDNRVLPSFVDSAEVAKEGNWWHKPEYMVNDLNINSVITTPAHGDILTIKSSTPEQSYTLNGYAYSGGGKKVTRVEVTMDDGKTWKVCSVDDSVRPTMFGKYWWWRFWSLEVKVLDLLGSKEIAVRAWDETTNMQPEKLIWNLVGIMNNCWFRVKTELIKTNEEEIGIVFEHPTQPGSESGGWMEKQFEKCTCQTQIVPKLFTMSEVQTHNSADSCWIIIHGSVCDVTSFLNFHPGGPSSILVYAGTDCTEEFESIHSDDAKKAFQNFRIGELDPNSISADSLANNSVA